MRESPPAGAGGNLGVAAATPSDEALMTAYGAGDADAFDMLYARHKAPLYRYFARQLAEAEAHDCFQSLWLKVIGHRADYQPTAPFRHYLFSLAHNVLMDHYRRALKYAPDPASDPDELPADDPPLEAQQERRQLLDRLHGLIRALPTHQREVWLLRQETDLSTAEIARITDATEEGVKSRLRYARDKLKSGMARYAQPD